MSDRRSFLSVLGTSLGGVVAGGLTPAQLFGRSSLGVSAEPTVFWANPGGSRNLVRFLASGIEAPAGRLRVYDASRRLLGTAGMLRSEGVLRGELWIPLERAATVTSELEAPGVRGPFRTSHRLAPPKQWTIVWLTIAAPQDLTRLLSHDSALDRAVRTAVWHEAGVIANPLPASWRLHQLDHLPFLRSGDRDHRIEHTTGVNTASVAVIDDVDGFPATTPIALAGTDVRYVVRRNGGAPYAWWPAPDGSRILVVTLPAGADPSPLGFADTLDVMERRIAAHLDALVTERPLTIVAQTAVDERIDHMVAATREWNRRYAYPRILVGGAEELTDITAGLPVDDTPATVHASALPALAPAVPMAAQLAEERTTAMRSRVEATLRPLADRLVRGDRSGDPGLRLAGAIDTRVDGFLVVNPSPFRRSDVAHLPDGRRQLVTDVPPLGYAFVLDEGIAPLTDEEMNAGTARIDGSTVSVRLNERTGAIASIRNRSGKEWCGGGGFNATDGAVLVSLTRVDYRGLATEFVARRYSAHLGDFVSRVTVWRASPWIDIRNQVDEAVRSEFRYGFHPAGAHRRVRWEVPAGHQEAGEELTGLTHLRWLALDGDEGSVLLRGLETPIADIRSDGRVEFQAAGGVTHYRLWLSPKYSTVADCSRFGWSAEPFAAIPVSGTEDGSAPRFGNAVVLDQTDAALIGLETSIDGTSVTAFLQNLTAQPRFLTLGYGLLQWNDAHQVDFLGRETAPVTDVPDGLGVQVPGWGVVAVRMTGVTRRS